MEVSIRTAEVAEEIPFNVWEMGIFLLILQVSFRMKSRMLYSEAIISTLRAATIVEVMKPCRG